MNSRKATRHIACAIAGLRAGGAERVMTSLCNHFAEPVNWITLLTISGPCEAPFHRLAEQVECRPLGPSLDGAGLLRLLRIGQGVTRLRRVLEDLRPDVLISFVDMMNVMALAASRGLSHP